MCIFFTVGAHDFVSPLKGYEGVTAQCRNCGNYSAHVVRRWPWFTFCFVPILPLSLHPYGEVTCQICRFEQDISTRPDIQAQAPNAPNELTPQGFGGGADAGSLPPPGRGPPAATAPAPSPSMQYK